MLQAAKGQLAQQQARLQVARANLARVEPLAAQNALSKKDLDDAIGNEKQSAAAVIAARGEVETAQLNLGYTTIKSPLTGLSSFARQQDGQLCHVHCQRFADLSLLEMWMLLETDPVVIDLCERPGYMRIDGRLRLVDFWVRYIHKVELVILSNTDFMGCDKEAGRSQCVIDPSDCPG